MKLIEIEPVAIVVKDGPDYGLIESKVIQGISMLPVGTKFYTDLQILEYSEVKRDYILIIDGGIGTKLHATDRFTGTEAVDVYGDKYKVVNHVKNGKMWVLDNKEDTKNESR